MEKVSLPKYSISYTSIIMSTKEYPNTQESEFSSFARETMIKASEIAMRNFGKVSGVTKQDDNNQVLTETDIEIGETVVNMIRDRFPSHNIIDEEAGVVNNGSEYTWILDPIDGTSNFAAGSRLFGSIIGLLHKDIPIVGGVALPPFEEIYLAERGKGAYCNGERLHVTSEQDLSKVLIGYSIDGHQENPQITYDEVAILADIILGCRNLRTSGSVFDAMLVAQGKYGGYHHRNTKIWDVAGMQVIIEEAGGIFTDFNGNPIDYSYHLQRAKDKYPFCTASPTIHTQLQTIINKARN